jgi:exodeoxyribonuclease VII large subunit
VDPSIRIDGGNDSDSGVRPMWSVSALTSEIKNLLENNFSFIWIFGEISNFKMPASGHFYFTLKDDKAQIAAVMFRGQNRNLKFKPEDGMEVVGLGRMSVYEPRGSYQIILEYLEPKGVGALRIAFEQLKQKLADDGLFNDENKQPLPYLPSRIAIITSQTGAVVHDMIRILQRRFENVVLQVVPVRVQGPGAETEIAEALGLVNRRAEADVVILARGGGSLEDLWAFNTESVARAVFASAIPVISAVGHETDFSICDFVADLRAPTPSAAAELAVPVKSDLVRACSSLSQQLAGRIDRHIGWLRERADALTRRLVSPAKRIGDHRIRLDDLGDRMNRGVAREVERCRLSATGLGERLAVSSPLSRLKILKEKLNNTNNNLLLYNNITIGKKSAELDSLTVRLGALNPKAILSRGYSITRSLPGLDIIRAADQTAVGEALEVLLGSGRLTVKVLENR